jgi:poly(3-hydroxybutyrate) depolymerase
MYDRLIENMIIFEDIDPNRVYFLGYSCGGDGVYQIAPRIVLAFIRISKKNFFNN